MFNGIYLEFELSCASDEIILDREPLLMWNFWNFRFFFFFLLKYFHWICWQVVVVVLLENAISRVHLFVSVVVCMFALALSLVGNDSVLFVKRDEPPGKNYINDTNLMMCGRRARSAANVSLGLSLIQSIKANCNYRINLSSSWKKTRHSCGSSTSKRMTQFEIDIVSLDLDNQTYVLHANNNNNNTNNNNLCIIIITAGVREHSGPSSVCVCVCVYYRNVHGAVVRSRIAPAILANAFFAVSLPFRNNLFCTFIAAHVDCITAEGLYLHHATRRAANGCGSSSYGAPAKTKMDKIGNKKKTNATATARKWRSIDLVYAMHFTSPADKRTLTFLMDQRAQLHVNLICTVCTDLCVGVRARQTKK